jgi:AcrR family transcriptional regulator
MDTKHRILDEALTLFSQKGYANVYVGEIAEKVGIKAPSLYNHFSSKEEIINAMYSLLRSRALTNIPSFRYTSELDKISLEDILLSSAKSYMEMVRDEDMLKFFKVIYSERATDKTASLILVSETERMIRMTTDMFYALAIHKRIRNENVDEAALTYALTLHSLIDYRMDLMTAGNIKESEKIDNKINDFIKFFSRIEGV